MPEIFYKMVYFAVMYSLFFGVLYLYGRKSFPKRSIQLNVVAWIILMVISYFNGMAAGLIAVPVILTFMFVLRKPSQRKALLQFYADNKIFSSNIHSQSVLAVLGDKNWMYAEGMINKNPLESVKYLFWQGYTKSTVSTGQYTRSTTFTHYLAFIFPPGSVSNIFKQHAFSAADKSGYTFRQKLKFFFVPDTDKPCRVLNAADGSFIIEYYTVPDVEHYSKQLSWIEEHFSKMYIPATELYSAN